MKDEEILKGTWTSRENAILRLGFQDGEQAERKRILDILKLKRKWTREELRQKIKEVEKQK